MKSIFIDGIRIDFTVGGMPTDDYFKKVKPRKQWRQERAMDYARTRLHQLYPDESFELILKEDAENIRIADNCLGIVSVKPL